ncbi:flagellar basal body P-ring formation chaperone FlgA [Neokomagataea tanensis]|nr:MULTISPECIES: flagellar basal body P-ring formation chaperone FlgA [Neokomagataea]
MSHSLAATLRPSVELDHARVRLSDLFAGLAPGQDVEIGDAPAFGDHYTVGGEQLTAIAAQFAVDWPGASPLVSVTLTRKARWITEDDVLPLVKQALILPDQAEVDLTLENFKAVAVPSQDQGGVVLVRVEHPGGGGHFTARFRVPNHEGGLGTFFTVTGNVQANIPTIILKKTVKPGQVIMPEDVTTGLSPVGSVPEDALSSGQEAIGLVTRYAAKAGTVLGASQLVRPQLVHRGSPVVVTYHGPNVSLTVSGTVLEAGGRGDTVHVYNMSSKMILTGKVVGQSSVDVLDGVAPLVVGTRIRETLNNLPTL